MSEEKTEDQLEEEDSAPDQARPMAPRTVTEEQVAALVEKLAPQPEPPAAPKQMRFTVICGSKKIIADHEQRDVAAVHILAIDVESAKFSAKQLLGANVEGTTPDDWDAVIAYLGFQEIL